MVTFVIDLLWCKRKVMPSGVCLYYMIAIQARHDAFGRKDADGESHSLLGPRSFSRSDLRWGGGRERAMRDLGNADKQEIGRWANTRVENSHLPFRRRERAMLRFRRMKTLQKFASVHANLHNHFNLERHLVDRQAHKEPRSAALAEWQSVAS